jgi:hypothetical protein
MQVIQDTCVIPIGESDRLQHHDVLVDAGRIVAVRPSGDAPPQGARLIDGSGRWLIPGLIDTHVHFWEAEKLAPYGSARSCRTSRSRGSATAARCTRGRPPAASCSSPGRSWGGSSRARAPISCCSARIRWRTCATCATSRA